MRVHQGTTMSYLLASGNNLWQIYVSIVIDLIEIAIYHCCEFLSLVSCVSLHAGQLVNACQANTNFSIGTLRQGPQLYRSIKKVSKHYHNEHFPFFFSWLTFSMDLS